MRKLIYLLGFMLTLAAWAQDENDAIKYAETITKDDLFELLSIIASDAMEGRETGERGQKMAAAFIADHFERLGLEPVVPVEGGMSYYQKFELERITPAESYMMIDGQKLIAGDDIVYRGKQNMSAEAEVEVVFVGKGTKEDFEKTSVEGKGAMAVCYECSYQDWRGIMVEAESAGARVVLIATSETQESYESVLALGKRYFMRRSMGFATDSPNDGTYLLSAEVAAKIMGTSTSKLKSAFENGKKLKSGTVTYRSTREVDSFETENILGFLEGTDKKDEIVVITAHYDHIGRQGENINNGADDDGSGTSSVLELAEAFVKAKEDGKGPRRSILFMTVTGEEKGLLGSKYYSDFPIFPLENTVVDLNIDMIGRVDEAHEDNPNYVYLVGSDRLSSELHEISEKVNDTFINLDLDYTYNDENHPDRIYYRSDHWNFAKNNVPIIFYFNGTHEDYHRPTDTIDKIEFDQLTQRARLVFYTAWVLANREDRPVVDKLEGTVDSK